MPSIFFRILAACLLHNSLVLALMSAPHFLGFGIDSLLHLLVILFSVIISLPFMIGCMYKQLPSVTYAEGFLEDFIKQNFLPLAVPINHDTLKILKDDERKIVLTIMEDESEEKSQKLIKLLKAAASANRDLVFGYVGVKQWEDFADTFGSNKKAKLPKMVVWDGDEGYLSVSNTVMFKFIT